MLLCASILSKKSTADISQDCLCVYNILYIYIHVQISIKWMLKVSAFSSCFSPGLLPAQADSSCLQVEPFRRAYDISQRLIDTGTSLTHTQQLWDGTGAHQHPHVWLQQQAHFTLSPEALSSTCLLQFLQHAYMWHKRSDHRGRELGNHPLRRHKKSGELGSSGAGLS